MWGYWFSVNSHTTNYWAIEVPNHVSINETTPKVVAITLNGLSLCAINEMNFIAGVLNIRINTEDIKNT